MTNPPLYILAFDHRVSLNKMFGPHGSTYAGANGSTTVDYSLLKEIIYDGLLTALPALSLSTSDVGILVDEEFGAGVARRARQDGVLLAMPAEKSMAKIFELEYGDEFASHIEEFDPDQVKILAFKDTSQPEEDARLSRTRLAELSDWLAPRRQKFMVEILVTPTAEHLESVGGSTERFEEEIRPRLMCEAIAELQAGGVEADVWKVEGLHSEAAYREVVTQATDGGRTHAQTIILGRGAPEETVRGWLRMGAAVPGLDGFAIGRSTWSDAVTAFMDGHLDRTGAAQQIGRNFAEYVTVFREQR
ncbi:2-deoxy-5-keto-D-gluconate 6-phosphate aldolase domain-containing protein [Ruania rhizosphaerae]|uniref:2-deoxy-5-keto-D-gluconate 6-phosphate aldolase domain-containing protein n=1 Tax=Ruania rhizosphaerae TaxID=1840413 RepID=UPI001356986E|nr:DUF2090 domain-containing protein [Ruania rhizosphaerae]